MSCSGLLLVTVGTRPEPWKVDPADALKLEEIQVGDWVRVRTGVPAPKYGWEDVARGSVGVVYCIDEEGDVGVGFGFRVKPFECSLADVEKVPFFPTTQGGEEGEELCDLTEKGLYLPFRFQVSL